ncbi:MAG: hypothetical protein LUG60_10500 [Erysipelotrichaceae bacterium]|nr:hypothetical protein [Erysipelotrichaceae bacterium]
MNDKLDLDKIIANSKQTKIEETINLIRNLYKLNKIKNLKLDEEVTFSNEFVDSVCHILFLLDYQPEVFPNFDGNIQLEYEKDSRYLEIEITPSMKVNIFKIDDEEYENDEYNDLNINNLNNTINNFMR